jgi:chemotaxis signal transduction protein
MRPLPVERIAGMLSFVRGVSIIRGVPTPVVDLGVVLGTPGEAVDRFVTLRALAEQLTVCETNFLRYWTETNGQSPGGL